MDLLIRPQTEQINGIRRSVDVTPESAGWRYVSFAVYLLSKEQVLEGTAGGRETALVVLYGKGEAKLNGQSIGQIGERLSVFEEKAPYTLYLSTDGSYQVRCTSDVMEVAVASAPATGQSFPARLLKPEEASIERRGEGNTFRRVQHLLDTDQKAERLLLVEVITPAGNWSSFPPHKHDTENPPYEAYLEETYYHHTQPADGCAIQRVYTPGEFDEAGTVHNGDLLLVPQGYHMVGTDPRCDPHYFNLILRPHPAWNLHVDPAFHCL